MPNQNESQNPSLLFGNSSRPIKEAWEHFLKFNGMDEAPDEQKTVMEFVYYCGCMMMYNTMINSMRKDPMLVDMVGLTARIREDLNGYYSDKEQKDQTH
jgi:hypothetical protein